MKLHEHMKIEGLDKSETAKQLGWTVRRVDEYLTGERIPRPNRMVQVYEWSKGRVAPNDWVLK